MSGFVRACVISIPCALPAPFPFRFSLRVRCRWTQGAATDYGNHTVPRLTSYRNKPRSVSAGQEARSEPEERKTHPDRVLTFVNECPVKGRFRAGPSAALTGTQSLGSTGLRNGIPQVKKGNCGLDPEVW